MPKLRDILTLEDYKIVGKLRYKMLSAETIKDSDYYRKQIEDIFEQAKQRYYAFLNQQSSEDFKK